MHRTNYLFRIVLWSLMPALLVCSQGAAQPPAPPPGEAAPAVTANPVIVPVEGTHRVQMSTKKRLVTVINQKEAVARVQPVQGDPSTVLITGLVPGITRITMTDENKVQETFDVIVQ